MKSRKLTVVSTGVIAFFLSGMTYAIVTDDIPTSEASPASTTTYSDFVWDYIYSVGGASGVAVSSYWLLTAKHVTSGNIVIGSETYYLQETVAHASADIRLARYDKAFPGYYPIYTGNFPGIPGPKSDRLTGLMVGYGRTGNVLSSTTYEWHGSSTAGTKRWGDSLIDDTENDSNIGDYFIQYFNTDDTNYAAGAADRDSGGGVFVKSGGTWYLAGTMVAVTPSNSPYTGTVSVRLPSYAGWIVGVIPEPATAFSLIVGAGFLFILRQSVRQHK